MDLNQVKLVASKYLALLNEVSSNKHDTGSFPLNEYSALSHVVWMCEQIESMENKDKAMRWLCFIQGILWMTDKRTIDEMRDDNR